MANSPYLPLLLAVAKANNIPTNVAVAQIKDESGFNPTVSSPAGAEGIAQFMPATGREYGVTDPFNPQQALRGYGKMMGALIAKYGVAGALSAYNSGNPTAYRDPNFANGQTYNYVRNILGASGQQAAPDAASVTPTATSVPVAAPGPAAPTAAPVSPLTALANMLIGSGPIGAKATPGAASNPLHALADQLMAA